MAQKSWGKLSGFVKKQFFSDCFLFVKIGKPLIFPNYLTSYVVKFFRLKFIDRPLFAEKLKVAIRKV